MAYAPGAVRYQVFLSSTFRDLEVQRQAVVQAVLELGCIPVAMEIFPATNERQWSYIRRAIDQCDYYVVVSAGLYGSLGPRGLSYTEMEYRYAREIGKPLFALLHEDPSRLPASRREPTVAGRRKLAKFRTLCKQRLCKYWSSQESLVTAFTTSLIRLIQAEPASGWIDGAAYQELASHYRNSQEFVRQIVNLQRFDFKFKSRRMHHVVEDNGDSLLTDEVTIEPLAEEQTLYITGYGAHSGNSSPVVSAYDSQDRSPLSTCILRHNNSQTIFAILLKRPIAPNSARAVTVTCERPQIWKALLARGYANNSLSIERVCDELTIRFDAPAGRTWKALTSTPEIGAVSKSTAKGRSILVWRMSALPRMRIGYSLSLDD
jgi:Domain of unknown function (DUF4062)